MDASLTSTPAPLRPTRGFAIAAALATLGFSAAIGCVAVSRWRRALFWLVSDWVWAAVMISSVPLGHPRLLWIGMLGFLGWRFPAAIDAYRLARRAPQVASWSTLIRAWVILTVGAIGAARGVIRPFLVEAFSIPTQSMYPTLVAGDHIFVDKLDRTPRYGAVVVFKYPLDPRTDYVKRVVGLPGDVVEISEGIVKVNRQQWPRQVIQERCPVGADEFRTDEADVPCAISSEIVDQRTHLIATESAMGAKDLLPVVVPRDAVFVIGDNRGHSSDSRVWGPVPIGNIKGTVRFIWWSAARSEVRWSRINQAVR
jgi:signal peptidase I